MNVVSVCSSKSASLSHYLTICLIFQVPLVPEGLKGTKDLRDQLVSLARRERKGTRVLLGYEEPEENRVSQDHQVCQG